MCIRDSYGIVLSGAIPIYLNSDYNSQLGIFSPPRIEDIKNAINSSKRIKLLILTGCTYDGILSDIQTIVDISHNAPGGKIKVMIDEAWFAYSNFHPNYNNYAAVNCGADYITHSSHKVLSSFSQASMIHINDPDFDQEYFREIYYMHTLSLIHI